MESSGRPDVDIQGGLAEIRRRRRWFWAVFLTYLPGVALLGGLASGLTGREESFSVVAIGWMAAFVVTSARVVLSSCPRCGEQFHSNGQWHHPWTQRCLNCHLPLRSGRRVPRGGATAPGRGAPPAGGAHRLTSRCSRRSRPTARCR